MPSLLTVPSMLFSGDVVTAWASGAQSGHAADVTAAAADDSQTTHGELAAAAGVPTVSHGIGGALGLEAGAGVLVAAARLLAALGRHHTSAQRRCMALAAASARALLAALAAWRAAGSPAPGGGDATSSSGGTPTQASASGSSTAAVQLGWGVDAAQGGWWRPGMSASCEPGRLLAPAAATLSAVYAGVADHKELAKYSLHLLVRRCSCSRAALTLVCVWLHVCTPCHSPNAGTCRSGCSLLCRLITLCCGRCLRLQPLLRSESSKVPRNQTAIAAWLHGQACLQQQRMQQRPRRRCCQGCSHCTAPARQLRCALPTCCATAAVLRSESLPRRVGGVPISVALLRVSTASMLVQIQHLFVTLGGRASGRGRAVLADLRRGYETDFKYEGKV